MKTCSKCNLTKSEAEFGISSRNTARLNPKCKACVNVFQKGFYAKNKELVTAIANKSRLKKLAETRNNLKGYLADKKCVDCGVTDFRLLDFDHTKDKVKSISRMVLTGVSWINIQKEIAKCEIRCANCHRLKTAKDLNWWYIQ